MEDRADLVRLAFRARALSIELEEMERLLDEVVTPGIRRATASLQAIQAQLRELAGVERIDAQAAARAADEISWDARGYTDRLGKDVEQAIGDDPPLHRPI